MSTVFRRFSTFTQVEITMDQKLNKSGDYQYISNANDYEINVPHQEISNALLGLQSIKKIYW